MAVTKIPYINNLTNLDLSAHDFKEFKNGRGAKQLHGNSQEAEEGQSWFSTVALSPFVLFSCIPGHGMLQPTLGGVSQGLK